MIMSVGLVRAWIGDCLQRKKETSCEDNYSEAVHLTSILHHSFTVLQCSVEGKGREEEEREGRKGVFKVHTLSTCSSSLLPLSIAGLLIYSGIRLHLCYFQLHVCGCCSSPSSPFPSPPLPPSPTSPFPLPLNVPPASNRCFTMHLLTH